MGKVIKGIGKVVGAIPKGVGHALGTSGIPILSGVGRTVENAGKGFAGDIPFFKGVLPAAGMALGGAGLLGGGPLAGILGKVPGIGDLGGSGFGHLAGTIGKAITAPNILGNAQGKLDLGKVIGLGGGISSMIGQNQQRKSAERYANAGIQQRNDLMSRILAPRDYGLGGQ